MPLADQVKADEYTRGSSRELLCVLQTMRCRRTVGIPVHLVGVGLIRLDLEAIAFYDQIEDDSIDVGRFIASCNQGQPDVTRCSCWSSRLVRVAHYS